MAKAILVIIAYLVISFVLALFIAQFIKAGKGKDED